MTSHELAHKLLAMDDVMVTRHGYEGGTIEISGICEPEELCRDVHKEWYYGPHEYTEYHCTDAICNNEKTKAINIG